MDAKEVRAIRARTRLTQAEFAEQLGVSVRTFQDWEQGRHQPRGAAAALVRLVGGTLSKKAPSRKEK